MELHTAAAAQYLFERGWFSAYATITEEQHPPFSSFCDALNDVFQEPLTSQAVQPYLPGLDSHHRTKGRNYPQEKLAAIAIGELREAYSRAQRL